MTPKEKADELFDKYYSYLKANLMDDKEAIDDAKQCALIAVDELIIQVNYLHIEYWKEVKQYIIEIP
jgi:hypothetical protein